MHDEPRYFNAQDGLFHCLDMPPRVRSRQPLPKILLPRLAKLKRQGDMGLLRNMRRMPAWLKTEIGMTCLIALAVVAIVGFAWDQMHRRAELDADTAARHLAAAVLQEVEGTVEQVDLTLQGAIGGRQSSTSLSLSNQERDALLFERTTRGRSIDFINVLDADGIVIARTPPRHDASDWSNRDYFVAQRDSRSDALFIGRPFGPTNEGLGYFPMSRRIMGNDGKFAGVVVASVRLDHLRDLFSSLEPGPRNSVTLLRNDGTIFMRLPFNRNDIGSIVDVATPFHEFMQTGSTSITAQDPVDHIKRQFLFHRVGTLPLIVSVGVATDEGNAVMWVAVAALAVVATVSALMRRLWRANRQRDAAKRESGEKSRFLTTLSHELRTPLHGVLGYADQLFHTDTLRPAQAHQVAEIVRACKHMRDVVNVVLDYARIEALGPELHMQDIDVRSLVDECMAIIEPGSKARGLETRVTIAPDAATQFVTDGVQLRQILMNLLSNAVKYTAHGAVELRVMSGKDHLTIEVADTGIGIPEELRHRLFKEFERFGAERTSIEGTGLGLAIAHRLARRMGGHMGHRDNPGGGSVFWLELPAGITDTPGIVPEAGEAVPQRPLNVLVVDDSEVNRQVAAAFLRQAGHIATEANDGSEAVGLVATQDFDVILMDMRMAGMDGLEATRCIRKLGGPRARVPIVAVTANALDQHAEECRRAGMSDHLAKPFTQAELLAVVMRAAARSEPPSCDVQATIDRGRLAELEAGMRPDIVRGLLDCLSLRIEALLRTLGEPTWHAAPETLADLAHELAGGAGQLGFARLSAVAARFQTMINADPGGANHMAGEIRREAEAALAAIRQRQAPGDMTVN
jgi:signal transduction histidine kinase/CheY-like chemotaxis protein/HPt (histidine-containing phosphotransfer) domain-containing protein